MLDQLKRLVSGSGSSHSGGVQADGIPPSGNRHQSRPHHGQSQAQSRSGSLSRLTAYALHPHQHQHQQSGRLRMQLSYGVVPVAYGPPPPVVAYGRSGRPVPVGYDPWYPVRYHQQQPRTPVSRQLSSRPDLAPGVASSTSSGGKKKSDVGKDPKDVVYHHHPTLHRDSVVPSNGRSRLVSSRSLDSIHPHRIHPPKEKPPPIPVENKSSSKKMKDFFQRIKVSVGGSNNHQSNNRSGQGQRTDEWLLLRPSCVNNSASKTAPAPPTIVTQRPTTPGLTAFRKIFSRSPSPPVPLAASTPTKKPISSSRSLFQHIIRPRSRSVSSSASLSVRSQSTHGSDDVRTTKFQKTSTSTTELNLVNRNGGPAAGRGHPDGATFPRISPSPSTEIINDIYAPASEPVRTTVTATTISPAAGGTPDANLLRRPKFAKKADPQLPGFRVRRRQSQLRRSERKRRSSRRRSGRKKNRNGANKKLLSSSKSASHLGSQTALSGAKLVSDWTYLPLPTSFTPTATLEEPVEASTTAQEPLMEASVQPDDDGWESDLYQVLVDRPRRNLPPPMWDPLIFIAPERRRSSVVSASGILSSDRQPWIRSSKLRADGRKEQLRRINLPPLPPPPPLSPSSSRSASSSGKTKKNRLSHFYPAPSLHASFSQWIPEIVCGSGGSRKFFSQFFFSSFALLLYPFLSIFIQLLYW